MLNRRVGPALVSRKIYIEQLVVHLRDKTCLELSRQFQSMTGITGTELVSQKELVSLTSVNQGEIICDYLSII